MGVQGPEEGYPGHIVAFQGMRQPLPVGDILHQCFEPRRVAKLLSHGGQPSLIEVDEENLIYLAALDAVSDDGWAHEPSAYNSYLHSKRPNQNPSFRLNECCAYAHRVLGQLLDAIPVSGSPCSPVGP